MFRSFAEFSQNKTENSMGKWQETNWPLTSTQMHQILKKKNKRKRIRDHLMKCFVSLYHPPITHNFSWGFPFFYNVKRKFNFFLFISSFFIYISLLLFWITTSNVNTILYFFKLLICGFFSCILLAIQDGNEGKFQRKLRNMEKYSYLD